MIIYNDTHVAFGCGWGWRDSQMYTFTNPHSPLKAFQTSQVACLRLVFNHVADSWVSLLFRMYKLTSVYHYVMVCRHDTRQISNTAGLNVRMHLSSSCFINFLFYELVYLFSAHLRYFVLAPFQLFAFFWLFLCFFSFS